jgi:hypothetical protein
MSNMQECPSKAEASASEDNGTSNAHLKEVSIEDDLVDEADMNESQVTEYVQDTYSEQLQKEGPWLVQQRRRRHGKDNIQVTIHNGSNPQRQLTRESNKGDLLNGAKREKGILLYLKNIDTEGKSDDELRSDIRKYGQSVGIRIMHADIVHNRYCQDVVGCKIRVPLSQKDKALAIQIWPEEVACRIWQKREWRENNGDQNHW